MFCYYRETLYEAICVKTDFVEDSVKYYIHYCGWGNEWNEWVTSERLLKYNKENNRIYVNQQREYELELLAKAKARTNSRRSAGWSKRKTRSSNRSKKTPTRPRIERVCKKKSIYYRSAKK